jgi:serine/threonine protein kinase
MPRRFRSSSRYLRQTSAERVAEQERLANADIAKIEPLTSAPDYLSITWLASKIGIYGEAHPSVATTAIRGTSFIGQGATFSVYRATYGDMVYAVKQPHLVFDRGRDESDTMRQLYSFHLELQVLTDRNVRAHGNIAKLIMILWEEHPDDLGRHWPSMVMEYADRGTLAACYEHGLQLGLESEKLLCFGIGDALNFLHENGVIHGDIKPENVLMFSGTDPGILIPKLSDFGFSVLDRYNTPRLPGGTPDWEAPEALERETSGKDLMHSDTYSFGLLVWYISRNGTAPFANLDEVLVDLEAEEAREVIRSLKKTARIPEIASNSLEPNKCSYSDVFNLTLAREPQRRNLKSALMSLGVGVSVKELPSTNIADLSHQTQNSEVSFENISYCLEMAKLPQRLIAG